MSAPIETNKPSEPKNNEITGQERVSTTVGFIIILIIVATIALLVWKYINAGQEVSVSAPVITTTLPKTAAPQAVGNEATAPVENNQAPADTSTLATNDATSAAGNAVDFDYEIKKLDDQVKPVNANDFGDSGLSDTQVGL